MTNSPTHEQLRRLREAKPWPNGVTGKWNVIVEHADLAWALERLDAMKAEIERREDDRVELVKRAIGAENSLRVCQESLREQAMARVDATMPLLVEKVVAEIRAQSEAQYAMAENRDERIVAHGLSLLCDWQDRRRAAAIADKIGG